MKVFNFEQGSVEWCQARAGLPTASEFKNLVTPKWKVRTGEMVETYLAEKLAEAWQNAPLNKYNTFDMDAGSLLENEAVPWLEISRECKVDRIGFITTDDGRIGCSPDGLIGDDCGLEVKCPSVHVHVKYLLGGVVPDEYLPQVQGGIYVTGRPLWVFESYCRHFPKLALVAKRDEEAQECLHEALTLFLGRFDRAMERLIEINGGPPPHMKPKPQPVMRPHDPDDYKV